MSKKQNKRIQKEIDKRSKVGNLIIDFALNYKRSTTGSLADLIFQIETIFIEKKIEYCNRMFKNGEIKPIK